jgi:hypothetical protein
MTVIDESGLHARPAARFVQAASRFASHIVIRNGEREADAKSLISLLGLAVRLSRPRARMRKRPWPHWPPSYLRTSPQLHDNLPSSPPQALIAGISCASTMRPETADQVHCTGRVSTISGFIS